MIRKGFKYRILSTNIHRCSNQKSDDFYSLFLKKQMLSEAVMIKRKTWYFVARKLLNEIILHWKKSIRKITQHSIFFITIDYFVCISIFSMIYLSKTLSRQPNWFQSTIWINTIIPERFKPNSITNYWLLILWKI